MKSLAGFFFLHVSHADNIYLGLALKKKFILQTLFYEFTYFGYAVQQVGS